MATLRIIGGDEGEQSIALGDGVVRIGRAKDNDIVLTGAEKGVSRLHAELTLAGAYLGYDGMARHREAPDAAIGNMPLASPTPSTRRPVRRQCT